MGQRPKGAPGIIFSLHKKKDNKMTLKEKVMELFGVSPDKSESVLGGNNVVRCKKSVEITDAKTYDAIKACVFADDLQESFAKTLRLMSELVDDETFKTAMCNGAIAVAERKIPLVKRIEKIGIIVCPAGYLRCMVVVTFKGVSIGISRGFLKNGNPSFAPWGAEGFSPESVVHVVEHCFDEETSLTKKLPLASISRYPVEKMTDRIVELFSEKED